MPGSDDDDLLQPTADNLAPLVVILRAAHLSGDAALERSARRELRERYGVTVHFDTDLPGRRLEVAGAN